MNPRALIASPLGFLIGLSLGALGGGGSVLAVPVLVYAAGQTPEQATATSLLVVGASSVVALLPHARAGRVHWLAGAGFGLVGVGGSLLGTRLNALIDPNLLLLLFSMLILVAAWRMSTACPSCTSVGSDRAIAADGGDAHAVATRTVRTASVVRAVKVVLAGSAIGFLTGLFGVGGGFVIVPALTLLLGFNMGDAIGTSVLVIAINSAVAFAGRLGTGAPIDWATTIPFALASFVGVLVGGRLSARTHPERLLRAFSVLLVAVALFVGVRAALAL
ncbi:MAG: sulfite exporter TauE/SafE family protein [Acidimicrobiia bacterium]|nr:sulfite exporter TauE/SafE family protein [Acidimicrobiia bacterium]